MTSEDFRVEHHTDRTLQRVAAAHGFTVEIDENGAAFSDLLDQCFETIPRQSNGLFSGADILDALGY